MHPLTYKLKDFLCFNIKDDSNVLYQNNRYFQAVATIIGGNEISRKFIINNLCYTLPSSSDTYLYNNDDTDTVLNSIKVNELAMNDLLPSDIGKSEHLLKESDCFIIIYSNDATWNCFEGIVHELISIKKSLHVPLIFVKNETINNEPSNNNLMHFKDVLKELSTKSVEYSVINMEDCFERLSILLITSIYYYSENEVYYREELNDECKTLDDIITNNKKKLIKRNKIKSRKVSLCN